MQMKITYKTHVSGIPSTTLKFYLLQSAGKDFKVPFPAIRLEEYLKLHSTYKSSLATKEEKNSIQARLVNLQEFLARRLAQMEDDPYVVQLFRQNVIPQELKVAALLNRKSQMLSNLVKQSLKRHGDSRWRELESSYISASSDTALRLAAKFDPAERQYYTQFYIYSNSQIGKIKITRIISSAAYKEYKDTNGVYTQSSGRKIHSSPCSLNEPIFDFDKIKLTVEDTIPDPSTLEDVELTDWSKNTKLADEIIDYLLVIATNPTQRAVIKLRRLGLTSEDIVNYEIYSGHPKLTSEEEESLVNLTVKDVTNIEKDIRNLLVKKGSSKTKKRTLRLNNLAQILSPWGLSMEEKQRKAANKSTATVSQLNIIYK